MATLLCKYGRRNISALDGAPEPRGFDIEPRLLQCVNGVPNQALQLLDLSFPLSDCGGVAGRLANDPLGGLVLARSAINFYSGMIAEWRSAQGTYGSWGPVRRSTATGGKALFVPRFATPQRYSALDNQNRSPHT
jgi:hypothetical protein